MAQRWKVALLLGLMGAALFTGAEALRSLRPRPAYPLPQEIYARYTRNAASAAYTLRPAEGRVAVYEGSRTREPLAVTPIELRLLRRADRAMIEAGLPVATHTELLQLLEDLGP